MQLWINLFVACALCLFPVVGAPSAGDTQQRFEFVLHDELLPVDVRHLKTALLDRYDRVLEALELASHPVVTVQVWKDEVAYQNAMQDALGMRAPGSRGYITGPQDVRLLLHTIPTAQKEAVHEFVHAASLTLNPSFGNNPRWLWEAVAQYVAEEMIDPNTNKVFAEGTCPTLGTLNSPFDRGGSIYVSGYLLGDFITSKWGMAALPKLIRLNGNTTNAFGLSEEQFETAWCQHVQSLYIQ